MRDRIKHKDHRDPTIRKTVVLLIPDLASYSPAVFASKYLHQFMLYLSGMLKREKERNDAFLAIGNVANSVKSAIAPYLDGVLIYVREGLSISSASGDLWIPSLTASAGSQSPSDRHSANTWRLS